MSYLIAVTGKGGVGKTTLSSLIIKHLIDSERVPVLAIDADPNSCLDAALGVKAVHTVGRAREDVRQEAASAVGISKHELLQLKLEESLVEANGFDLIAMGRPEGAGCYCYANNVLKSIIAEMSSQYPYVVLDNEAGLENLSRRIVQKVNMMVLISDASNAGLETLKRLYELAQEMGMQYDKLALVVNRLRSEQLPAKVEELKAFTHADYVIGLPNDEQVAEFAENTQSFLTIPADNPVYQKVGKLTEHI